MRDHAYGFVPIAATFSPRLVPPPRQRDDRAGKVPALAMLIFVLMLALYRTWTKPLVAGTLFVLFLVFYFGSTALDSNFRSIVMKPTTCRSP